MKLPLREAESKALLRELVEWEGFVSSSLLGVEALRACARYGSGYERAAREWMEGLSLLPIDDGVLDIAAELGPAGVRSLDALHLATAISLGDEVGPFFSYDDRLVRAAEENGLRVIQPT